MVDGGSETQEVQLTEDLLGGRITVLDPNTIRLRCDGSSDLAVHLCLHCQHVDQSSTKVL
jgi:hypothetical protein